MTKACLVFDFEQDVLLSPMGHTVLDMSVLQAATRANVDLRTVAVDPVFIINIKSGEYTRWPFLAIAIHSGQVQLAEYLSSQC